MNGNYISFIEKEMIYSNAVVANKNEFDFSIILSECFYILTPDSEFFNHSLITRLFFTF